MVTYARTNDTGAVYACPHGGTWKVTTGAFDKAEDTASYNVCFLGMAMVAIAACTATIPTVGVPPCIHVALIGLPPGTKKLNVAATTQLASAAQLSTSNMIPALLQTGFETVYVKE